jgi:predicted CXXCH cytochrome family protein
MNKFSKFLVGIALISMSGIGVVNAQMSGGAHDLNSNAGSLPAGQGQDLCRFCHTPHNSNAVAPLWDRNPPDTVTFALYDSPTMGNTMGQPTGVSQGCLSCHDGVTAFDSLLGLTGTGGNDMNTLYAASTAILGATLANDHPVGVDLLLAGEMELAATVTAGGLRLFGAGDTVECASCHDPHGAGGYGFFLRLDPAAGTLCETCHTK